MEHIVALSHASGLASEAILEKLAESGVTPDSLVLLDEPLTSVEPKIKWRLRQTLRKVQTDLGVTMIYVTHDQTEALTFADRVSILTSGGILQTASPAEIYQSPEHEFVGHFVGSPGMNFVANSALDVTEGERLGFRPEWATLNDSGPLQGVVKRTRIEGTRDGIPYGLVTLATEHGELTVRGAADIEVGRHTALRVHRYVAFAGQRKVGEGELV
jgi:glycerol transport system ATP-binding protein